MKPWSERPHEVANLLNPAFCAIVLRNVIAGYQKQGATGIDPSLLFLALPIALHPNTRRRIPKKIVTKLHSWMESNQELRVGFSARCKSLIPIVREAIVFGKKHDFFDIAPNGDFVIGKKKLAPTSGQEEVESIFSCAIFIGRWFHDAGSPAQVYLIWGVMP